MSNSMMPIRQGKLETVRDRQQMFLRFVVERDAVRERKERGEAKPWTTDKILQTYHFCNIKRADDRVTRFIGDWLPKNPKMRWFGCAVARWINEPVTLARMPSLEYRWQPQAVVRLFDTIKSEGKNIFRGSYIINGGGDGMSKAEAVVHRVLTPLYQNPPKIYTGSCERSWQALLERRGHGSFMAGQIVADWNTFGVINGMDSYHWAPLGPGSRKGLAFIYDRAPGKIKQEQGVTMMREMHQVIFKHDTFLGKYLNLHDVQNCLCEFSKYVRGYSKTTYRPFGGDGQMGLI